MRRWPLLLLLQLMFFFCYIQDYGCHSLSLTAMIVIKEEGLIPKLSPDSAPHPFIPFLAPSPSEPFDNTSPANLSGLCALNFASMPNLITTTTFDCWATFGPFLANVICCPQLEATVTILIGQFSKNTEMLALDATHANHCLSDLEKILRSQGANNNLRNICSIQPQNLTASSCPVTDIKWLESLVDTYKILAYCKKVDAVNECCTQLCQNAILDVARKLAQRAGVLPSTGATHTEQSIIHDCSSIVLRWLASRLDTAAANEALRRISNCEVNKVCPLAFPDTTSVAKVCGTEAWNQTVCCDSIEKYISHLQKQSFITNLQALNCAAFLGIQLQKMNISRNVYMLCQITLKHFSVQVGSQESGCLLPSLPSDVTLDHTSGISFTCDLNDNIAAPWPSSLQLPTSSCKNKNSSTFSLPELPAATSANSGIYGQGKELLVLSAITVILDLLGVL